jgi:hypothetical protein
MKNGLNKKIMIFICLVVTILATGYAPWERVPNLINANKPFVDLSGSIGESIGNANKAYEKAMLTPAPDDTMIPTVTPIPTDIPDIQDPEAGEIMIIVGDEDYAGSGEVVYIKNFGMDPLKFSSDSFETLKETLQNKGSEGYNIILVDNYAETKVYRILKNMLEDAGISFETESING